MPTAIENADAVLENCRNVLGELGDKAEPEWKETLESVINAIEKLKLQFFIKTNMAVPGTKACLKDVTEIRSVVAEGDLTKMPDILARLLASLEKLLSQAKMEGIALT
jgi:hypothetical protein